VTWTRECGDTLEVFRVGRRQRGEYLDFDMEAMRMDNKRIAPKSYWTVLAYEGKNKFNQRILAKFALEQDASAYMARVQKANPSWVVFWRNTAS